jgi:hypothetical protein
VKQITNAARGSKVYTHERKGTKPFGNLVLYLNFDEININLHEKQETSFFWQQRKNTILNSFKKGNKVDYEYNTCICLQSPHNFSAINYPS